MDEQLESPRPKRELTKLSDAIQAFLKKSRLGPRLEAQPVFDAFREGIPTDKRGDVDPVRFSGGVLEVTVNSSTLLHELRHFQTNHILQRIRERVPMAHIQSIRYRLAATPKEK